MSPRVTPPEMKVRNNVLLQKALHEGESGSTFHNDQYRTKILRGLFSLFQGLGNF